MPGASGPPAPGEQVRCGFTKWGDYPHWSAVVTYLGEDEHGWWLGDPVDNHWSRPDATFDSTTRNVLLASRDRGFMATFYGPDHDLFQLYVDVTTQPAWVDGGLTAIDLDLDVIRRADGTLFVDDEDEFAEHQVSLGYPREIVVGAQAECDRLVADLQADPPAPWADEALVAGWRRRFDDLRPA